MNFTIQWEAMQKKYKQTGAPSTDKCEHFSAIFQGAWFTKDSAD